VTVPLDRDTVLRAFRLMARHLAIADARGELLLAGGAVMVIVYDVERVTRDVDGVILEGHGAVTDAARRVAAELHLPRGWLNEGVSVYLSTQPDPEATPIFDHPNLAVMAVSTEHLLALKARAARAQDLPDLQTLCAALDVGSAADIVRIVDRFFPEDPLTPRARAIIDDLFRR
jgi:predicted nucleotidyltransferase